MLPFSTIEHLTEKRLLEDAQGDGKALWGGYIVAREKVFEKILPYIRSQEPALTEHDGSHVVNVLANAYKLLGRPRCIGSNGRSSLTPIELYFLCLSILFHDCGNIFGRKGHEARLEEAYTEARGGAQSLASEKRLVFQIVRSHSGLTSEGSPDTLAQLDPHGSFGGKQVNCQRIASILRLADELAEGPQRTSLFMQQHLSLPKDSQVYHDYANITSSVNIDRSYERIAVVYDIDITPEVWGGQFDPDRLGGLLSFCYHRMVKLDIERKYNRHYCPLLEIGRAHV